MTEKTKNTLIICVTLVILLATSASCLRHESDLNQEQKLKLLETNPELYKELEESLSKFYQIKKIIEGA